MIARVLVAGSGTLQSRGKYDLALHSLAVPLASAYASPPKQVKSADRRRVS